MADLHEVLREGKLDEAIAQAISEVKAKPTDAESRYRLFALLAFFGDLHRARKQLEALGMGDDRMMRAKAVYINLLASEQERRAVFHHGAEPLLPPDPPAHLQLRLAALRDLADGRADDAAVKLDEAVENLPDRPGTLDGEEMIAWRDLDDLLGSVLEVYAGGRYMWLPLERIDSLEIQPLPTCWTCSGCRSTWSTCTAPAPRCTCRSCTRAARRAPIRARPPARSRSGRRPAPGSCAAAASGCWPGPDPTARPGSCRCCSCVR